MLRIPMPIILAVIVATAAVTVYLHLTVISVPAVSDGNFTTTLVAGSPYLWRGSAGYIRFESNTTIGLTYRPFGYVIHLNGLPSNVSITSDIWIVYLRHRDHPFLYIRDHDLNIDLLFKLTNVTKIGGVSVYVPTLFAQNEVLTASEADAVRIAVGSAVWPFRAVNVNTNGTHLIVTVGHATSSTIYTHYLRLPNPIMGTSMTTSFTGIGFSYIISGTTYSGYAMPYVYFAITPQGNAVVTIYVR